MKRSLGIVFLFAFAATCAWIVIGGHALVSLIMGVIGGAGLTLGAMIYVVDDQPSTRFRAWPEMTPDERRALARAIIAHEDLRSARDHA